MTIGQLRKQGAAELQAAGIENSRFEADCLLVVATEQDRAGLLLHTEDAAARDCYYALLRRRIEGEPLQYILGEWDFLDITLQLGPGVLIPRPETEALARLALEAAQAQTNPIVVDLCAGSGCIGFSVAQSCPGATVYLLEKSEEAFRFLKINEKRLHLANTYCILGDVYEGFAAGAVPRRAHVLVSNPPYIPAAELCGLQREVQREPAVALDGGADGLDFYRGIADKWLDGLQPGGLLALECGEGQAEAVTSLLFQARRMKTSIHNDFRGVARFVTAEKNAQGKKE